MSIRPAALMSVLSCMLLGSLAVTASAGPKDRIEVFISDMSKQCEGGGNSLADDEKKLVGIKVYARRKGNDGKMYTQPCGGRTGGLNIYTIRRGDLPKAIADGFAQCGAGEAKCI